MKRLLVCVWLLTVGCGLVSNAQGVMSSARFRLGGISCSEPMGRLTVFLDRSGNLEQAAQLRWRISGGEDAAADFEMVEGVAGFAAGGATALINLDVKDNREYSGNRTYALELASSDPALEVATPEVALVVKENDLPSYPGLGASGEVYYVFPVPGGGAVAVGNVKTVDGVPSNYIFRLNGDHTLDRNCQIPAFDSAISDVVGAEDGRMYVLGTFRTGSVFRLNPNGEIDPSFAVSYVNPLAGPGGAGVGAMASDGRIYVAGGSGGRYALNGVESGLRSRGIVGIVDANGQKNGSFVSCTAGTPREIAVARNGKIYLAGEVQGSTTPFILENRAQEAPRSGLVRLNADGSLDLSFNSGLNVPFSYFPPFPAAQYPEGMQLYADERVLVWGSFTAAHGQAVPGLIRLNADGSLDQTFLANVKAVLPSGRVREAAVSSDGTIGFIAPGAGDLVLLNADGTLRQRHSFVRVGMRWDSLKAVSTGGFLYGGSFVQTQSNGVARDRFRLAWFNASGELAEEPSTELGRPFVEGGVVKLPVFSLARQSARVEISSDLETWRENGSEVELDEGSHVVEVGAMDGAGFFRVMGSGK